VSANCSATSVRCVTSWYPVVISLVMVACASTPRVVEFRFSQESFLSRDGSLRFQLPAGWTNATADSPTADNLIWLVKNDDAASLTVRRVTIDETTRKEIHAAGLERLGELLLSLESSERGASVVKRPTFLPLDGIGACRYEYMTGETGDHVCVVLADAGSGVYEVSMRTSGQGHETILREITSLQEAFVKRMVW